MKKIVTEFYGTGTIGERGQIVIPAEARSNMNIQAGDKFVFIGHGSILHILPAGAMDKIFCKIHQSFEEAIGKTRKGDNDKSE